MATITSIQHRLLNEVSQHPNFVKDLDTKKKVEQYVLKNGLQFVYSNQSEGFFVSCNKNGRVEHHGILVRHDQSRNEFDWTNWVADNEVHPTLNGLTNFFLKSI